MCIRHLRTGGAQKPLVPSHISWKEPTHWGHRSRSPSAMEWSMGFMESGWWYTYPAEKIESQLGWSFPIYGKTKNVPNHQPGVIQGQYSIQDIFALRWSMKKYIHFPLRQMLVPYISSFFWDISPDPHYIRLKSPLNLTRPKIPTESPLDWLNFNEITIEPC